MRSTLIVVIVLSVIGLSVSVVGLAHEVWYQRRFLPQYRRWRHLWLFIGGIALTAAVLALQLSQSGAP